MHIVYSSFGGRYSDSPRAVHEALLLRTGDVRHTWLADPLHHHGFPPRVRTVPFGSAASVEALQDADVIVANTYLDLDWRKRPGAVYVQTWHGTPLKRIHFDALWTAPGRLDPLAEDVARWDFLLSPNAASTEPLRSAFRYAGEVVESGYPRNDVLVAPQRDEVRARVRAELGIPEGATAVLYAPTWRDDLVGEDGRADFALQLDLADLTARLGGDTVLLLRLHYMLAGRLGPLEGTAVRDVSFHPEISDLYLAADAMVTDYSSAMFDFGVTGKPMLFFTYDLAHYRDTLRGFYFDFEAMAPGPLLRTSAEVVDALHDLDAVRDRYQDAYVRFQDRFCHLDDGRATARVLERCLPFLDAGPLPAPTAGPVTG